MKYYFIFFLLLSFSYSLTNTNTLEKEIEYVDRKAVYIKAGETFKAPFTGWFFSVDSTKILIKDQTEVIYLRKENKNLEAQLLNKDNEVKELKFRIEGHKYLDDLNKLQIDMFKESLGISKKKDRFELSKEGNFIAGTLFGLGISALTYWGMSQIK